MVGPTLGGSATLALAPALRLVFIKVTWHEGEWPPLLAHHQLVRRRRLQRQRDGGHALLLLQSQRVGGGAEPSGAGRAPRSRVRGQGVHCAVGRLLLLWWC